MAGVTSSSPILPAYGQSLGFDPGTVGWLIASFGIARFLTNLPAGMLSERVGPFPVVVAALMITATGSVLAAWASSWQELLAARSIQGIGSSIYMTISIALVAQIGSGSERGRRMALYETSLLTGAVIGPLFGGFVAHYVGLYAPFLGQALFNLLALALFACFSTSLPNARRGATHGGAVEDEGPYLTAGRRALRMIPAYYLSFSIFFTRTVAQFYLIPLIAVDELGFTHQLVGFLLAAYGLASFAPLPFVGRLIGSIGSRPASLIGNLIVLSALMGLFLSDSRLAFWLFTVGLAFGTSMLGACSGAITADLANPATYGRVFGIARMWGDAGYVLGPIIVGTAISETLISVRGGFFVNTLAVSLALLAIGTTLYSGRRRDPRGNLPL
jgi:MFS family permease